MLAFVLLASLLTFAGADCPNRQRIEESLREVHIPGAAIVAVNAHGIVYEHAFGYQSLLPSKPMDVDQSIFVLASISKTFIAVAVMQLVEQKLVDLDTDVNQYLNVSNRVFYNPTFPNQTLTLRQLLSHSSSIALAEHLQSGLYQPGDSAPAKESLAQMCFKYSTANTTNWLPRPPGNATLYSNEGTSLAALVVERMTEIPFHQYVKEKIFQPLNVSHMGVFLSNFTDTNDLVRHYAYAQDASFLQLWNAEFPQLNIEAMPGNASSWLHIPLFGYSGYPSGFFRMSARSLAAYLRMFVNRGHPLLSSRSIEKMKTVVGNGLIYPFDPRSNTSVTSPDPPSRRYGLCWHWRTLGDGRQYVGHGGSMPGMTHLMLVNEEHNTGVLVLTNSDTVAPIELTPKIYEAIESIHISLFRCFEGSSASSVRGQSLSLVFLLCCFLLAIGQ